jgi:hypothetical protein
MQDQNNNQDFFTKRHKMGFVFLLISMIIVIIVWYIDFKTRINYSAVLEQAKQSSEEKIITENSVSSDKTKDTDSDGLSDYDESNIYKTSPFLQDTDGDNLSDYEETVNGSDPNCPDGQTCYQSEEDVSKSTENLVISEQLNDQNTVSNSDKNLTEEEKSVLEQAFTEKNMTAEGIRSFLIENGVKEDDLKDFSDEQLLETYNSLMDKVKN